MKPREECKRMGSVNELMTRNVPRASANERVGVVLDRLRELQPEEASHVYLVDENSILIGQVPIENLVASSRETLMDDLRGSPPIEVLEDENAQMAALLAVEQHDADVAVIDPERHLLGAVSIGKLLALLHAKHMDRMLRRAGVRALHPGPTEPHETARAFRARTPWLVLGLAGGMLTGGVASFFEKPLQREVTLAFFLPLVVYMADAIGTQTETVLVRRLAYGPVGLLKQLMREGALGVLMGLAIGSLGCLGLLLWGGRWRVAMVIGLTIFCSSIIATLVASILPWALDRTRVDPALASGPVATVFQDLLSVATYLGIATLLL